MASNTPMPYDTIEKQLFKRIMEQVTAPVLPMTINNVVYTYDIKHGV